jgi:hypothetical protein
MLIRLIAFEGPNYLGELEIDWNQAQTLEYFVALAKEQYPLSYRYEIHYVDDRL